MDLARLALGDPDHPESVYCTGGRILFDDQRDVPDMQVITYNYGNFVMTCESGVFGKTLSKSDSAIRYGDAFPRWDMNSTRIEIYGTRGLMYLGRHGGGWQVVGENGSVVAQEYGMFPDTMHQINFIETLRSRDQPKGNIEQGHRSAALVHLANLSYRTGCTLLQFDAQSEKITNSDEAMRLNAGNYREGFSI